MSDQITLSLETIKAIQDAPGFTASSTVLQTVVNRALQELEIMESQPERIRHE